MDSWDNYKVRFGKIHLSLANLKKTSPFEFLLKVTLSHNFCIFTALFLDGSEELLISSQSVTQKLVKALHGKLFFQWDQRWNLGIHKLSWMQTSTDFYIYPHIFSPFYGTWPHYKHAHSHLFLPPKSHRSNCISDSLPNNLLLFW